MIVCLLADIAILAIGYVYKDWLWDFAVLDPQKTSGGVAITALSAFCGGMVIVIGATHIYFITGSTRTLEAMFKFSAVNSATEAVTGMTTEREPRPRDYEDQDDEHGDDTQPKVS